MAKKMVLKSCIVVAGLLSTTPALAADKMLDTLMTCRTISDVTERATCYDRHIDAANADIKARSAPRDPVRDFGASDVPVRKEMREEEPELENITSTIVSASTNAKGQWVLSIATGAVWRQSDSVGLSMDPEAGQAIQLKRAAMGSYMAKIDGIRAFRVKRVQ